MKNLFELFAFNKVKFFPYRTALVSGIFFEIDRNTEEAKEFEKELNRVSGAKGIDNHTVYEIKNKQGASLYVSCSDFKMKFGSSIKEQNW